jgi:Zinc finger C-x8-C-x5-C-x3-H type (and similar)
MTEEQLEQSKLIKLIQRIAKKSNTETKALAQKVLDNAVAATKAAKAKIQNGAAPAPGKTTNGSSSVPARPASQSGLPQKTDAVAGVKRPREGDANILPLTKKPGAKPIAQASKPLAVQQAERRKAELAKQSVAKSEKTVANGTSTAPAPRPKVIVAPQKPASSGVFASLMSASKKPGTTMAEKAAAAKSKPVVSSTTKKESSPQPAPAPSKPAFSFLDALHGMDKPKEVVKKKEEVHPNETEEERKKRLRKEERGKLRVSWADKLTEVRLFMHDPDEEVGRGDSMKRDVDDVGGEGRMLKLHLDDDDLEDDEGEELDSYESPTEVDFSDLDWEERKGHFVKTGGPEMPESKASEAQRLLEDSTIMVVYALPSDQPPSPKEPPDTDDDYEPDLASSFGDPPESVREKEKQWLALRSQERQAPAVTGSYDLNAMLRSMQHIQQPQQPQQTQIAPELQRTLELFGLPQPGSQPQAGPMSNINNLMAAVNQVKAQQAQAPPQPMFTQPAAVPPQSVSDILAALQAQNAQRQQGLPVGSHSNPNPYPGPDNEYSRKHARNDSAADDSDGKKNKKKRGAPTGGDVPYNYKTLVCTFWQKGQCIKGDDCTYRHSD